MRLERFDLLAFGPFSGTRLDFSAQPQALQLVYGPNEAGKSTTLRALLALLYGIPERTVDAHLHEMGKLRLGASLRAHDGALLQVVRRKGRKHTLLDEHERPLDESVLTSLLGGLDETLFRQMFGLDHERLRLGAEALLLGGGGVGEGLFDAGTGACSIHSALLSLQQEADALYRPKGQRKLNVALTALRERERERKAAMLSPQAFEEQKQALEQAEHEREQLRRQKNTRVAEQARLELLLRVLPLLARREQLERQCAELGEVRPLSLETTARVKALEQTRLELQAEVLRLSAQHADAQRARSRLPSEAGGAIDAELLRELTLRLGNHRAAERELSRLRGELSQVTRELAAIRKRIGQTLEGAGYLDAPRRARLRKTAEDLRTQQAELARGRLEHAALFALCEAALQRLSALSAPLAVGALSELVRGRAFVQLEAELARSEALLVQQASSLEQGLAQLGLTHPLSVLARLCLPEVGASDALRKALDQVERRAVEAQQKHQRTTAEVASLRHEIALLSAEGEPVSEEDLAEARSVRERYWRSLAADLRSGTPPVEFERLRAFEAAQRASDRVADRLRQESGRAGLLSQQRVRERALVSEQQACEAERADCERERLEFETRFRTLWQPTGLASRLPHDVASARERLATLIALAAEHERTEAEAARLRKAYHAFQESFEAQYRKTFGAREWGGERLAERVAEAERRLAQEAAHALEQKQLEAECQERQREHLAQRARLEGFERQVTELSNKLAAELSAIGLDPGLGADEALSCLSELLALEAHTREADTLGERIAVLERESASFAEDVRSLARAHLQVAESTSLSELLGALSDQAQRARDVRRDHETHTKEIERLEAERAGVEAKLASYERELQELLAQLAVPDLATLVEAESKVVRAEQLREARDKLEAELSQFGSGPGFLTLCDAARGLDRAETAARLEEIAGQREALDEQIRDSDQAIGRLSAGLVLLKRASGASERAEEAEAAQAQVQQLVRRYVEVRLALSILTREVERYRQVHQGPVLSRAAELFPRLTLGRYRGLDVDYGEDDTPRLCAVREDSVRVHVHGLSDGTRDQLYLSLRIASIARFLERNPALPIVLDDILLHFDDARSEVALKVLAELAARTQVLFFTHHARIVELAKRALAPHEISLHTLGGPRAATEPRDDGSLFMR